MIFPSVFSSKAAIAHHEAVYCLVGLLWICTEGTLKGFKKIASKRDPILSNFFAQPRETEKTFERVNSFVNITKPTTKDTNIYKGDDSRCSESVIKDIVGCVIYRKRGSVEASNCDP